MKKIKRLLSIVLVVALALSINAYSAKSTNTVVKADDSIAITYPTDRSVVAAGYIDITWNNISNAKNYKVYVNGQLKSTLTPTTAAEMKYEYYTTKVIYHEAYVVATLTDGTTRTTPKILFGVTKKGLGLATDMGKNLDIKGMGCAWYYNWGTGPSYGPQYSGLEFVPMQWGKDSANNISNRVTNWANKGYKYCLAFNEPDLQGQGVTSVTEAVDRWPSFMNKGIRVGSPASFLWPTISSWLQEFMVKIENNVDFITIHCYPENNTNATWFLTEVVDGAWKKYHKPIWITEFSTTGQYVSDDATKRFWEKVVPGLDEREYVERYAAFGFKGENNPPNGYNVALWYYNTGNLTPAGEMYKKLGNPSVDYKGKVVVPSAQQSGNNNITTPTVKKPARAVIRSAKNIAKKKIKVSLKKISGARYQVRCSDNRRFFGYWDKTSKAVNVTLRGLDKNTKYYIKARAFKLNGKTKLYGRWSKVKTVKVKK